MAEATAEETKAGVGAGDIRKATAFLSPEAFYLFPIAIALDLTGIILIFFGLDDFWITDIIGILLIGGYLYFRSGTLKVTYRAEERITKTVTKVAKWAKRLRWLRPLLMFLEFIPYVGVAPCWIILVYLELTNS